MRQLLRRRRVRPDVIGFRSNGSQVAEFVTACAARGATGIGAGVNYMGGKRIHVGFGNSPSDTQKLVWGAAGASANAPAWLRTAAQEGWNNPAEENLAAAFSAPTSGRSIVAARGGLWLRRGPGLGFDRAKLLDEGTEVTILGLDGEWARVDLQGDGRIDGHVVAAFLQGASSSDVGGPGDRTEEPGDEEALAELVAAEGTDGGQGGSGRKGGRPPRGHGGRSEE